jgi:hypothetical protein
MGREVVNRPHTRLGSFSVCILPLRRQANMAQIRQSRPDSGLGFNVKVLETFQVVPFSRVPRRARPDLPGLQGYLVHKNPPPRRTLPRVLRWSWRGGLFLMSEVPHVECKAIPWTRGIVPHSATFLVWPLGGFEVLIEGLVYHRCVPFKASCESRDLSVRSFGFF